MRFSIEAEQSIVGALLLDPNRIDDVLEIVQVEDFYNPVNRSVFKHIVDLSAKGVTADVITVSEAMEQSGVLEIGGGLVHLVELANNTPGTATLKAYCRIVSDRAIERR